MSKRIFLSSPTIHGDEQRFVKEAFDTNWVAPLGANDDGFEQDVAAYVGISSASALTSGTDALPKALDKYPNANAVIITHLYGIPAKLDEIMTVCEMHNVTMIEDAAVMWKLIFSTAGCARRAIPRTQMEPSCLMIYV